MMKNRPTRSTFQARLQHFTSKIREGRLSGELEEGGFLPSELELADQYQLSKMSVRKGLDQLVAEGVIEKIPRVGNRILPLPSSKQLIRFACHASLFNEIPLEDLIKQFEAQNPDMEVQIIPFSFQQYIETIDHYVDQDMADIITMNYDQYVAFRETNRLSLLEPQPKEPEMISTIESSFMHGDQLYARALTFSPLIICYNPDHFDELGLPYPSQDWTWQDLLASAKKLAKDQGRYGFYFNLLSQNRWPVFLLQNGYYYDPVSHKYDSDLFLNTMRLIKDVMLGQGITTSLIVDEDYFTDRLFIKNKASMIMTTYFSLQRIASSGMRFEVASLPYIQEPKTLLITIGLSILQSSSRKKEAQLFANFLCSYASQYFLGQNSFCVPAHEQAAKETATGGRWLFNAEHYDSTLHSLRYYHELGLTPRQLLNLRRDISLYWSKMYDEVQLLRALNELLMESKV